MRKTQRQWVEQQLLTTGEITRNQCLAQFISRLSGIIYRLENDGWVLEHSNRDGDYVYTLVNAPKRKKTICDIINGVAVPRVIEAEYGH